jgi:hypothetical protein
MTPLATMRRRSSAWTTMTWTVLAASGSADPCAAATSGLESWPSTAAGCPARCCWPCRCGSPGPGGRWRSASRPPGPVAWTSASLSIRNLQLVEQAEPYCESAGCDRSTHDHGGPHTQLVVARDVADENVPAGLEVDGELLGRSRCDVFDLVDVLDALAILVRPGPAVLLQDPGSHQAPRATPGRIRPLTRWPHRYGSPFHGGS